MNHTTQRETQTHRHTHRCETRGCHGEMRHQTLHSTVRQESSRLLILTLATAYNATEEYIRGGSYAGHMNITSTISSTVCVELCELCVELCVCTVELSGL